MVSSSLRATMGNPPELCKANPINYKEARLPHVSPSLALGNLESEKGGTSPLGED